MRIRVCAGTGLASTPGLAKPMPSPAHAHAHAQPSPAQPSPAQLGRDVAHEGLWQVPLYKDVHTDLTAEAAQVGEGNMHMDAMAFGMGGPSAPSLAWSRLAGVPS